MAEREGFEPSVPFQVHTLSRRAPSTARTSLRLKNFVKTFEIRPTKKILRSRKPTANISILINNKIVKNIL